MDKEIRKALKWKTKAERIAYLKAYTGYDDEPHEEREKKGCSEKSLEQFKEQFLKLKRELFHNIINSYQWLSSIFKFFLLRVDRLITSLFHWLSIFCLRL